MGVTACSYRTCEGNKAHANPIQIFLAKLSNLSLVSTVSERDVTPLPQKLSLR